MRNVIVFVLIFCSFSVTAQKKGFGKLAGRIVDHDSREELAGVSITVEKTSLGNATTVDGRFVILKVPVGVYKVKITCIGYTALIINDVVIKSNITTTIDTSLSADEVQLHEVAVVAERPVVNKSITSSVMSFSSFSIPYTRGGRAWEIGRTAEGITLPKFNTEEYDKINENEFLESIQNPLSTFSIDVDVASYTNMRRFINDGMLPPPDAIRTEELINYFSYDYPEPTDGHPVSFSTELSAAPWNSEHQLLLIGLQGKNIETKHLPSSNLVFLLDVSGSMNEPNKLPLVKSAFRLLVHQLRPQDNVAVVVYAGSSGIVLPSTSGKEKEKIISCIDRLEAGGTTAGGEGIVLAYKVAKENFLPDGNNRVILATDGDFNVGLSSDADLERLIEEKRKDGVFLSVLGFGTGNYKDSKMEKLADKGNGNYAYIDNLQEANKMFVDQMAGTLYTIAKDVKLQLEFNPAKVKAYRLIGYENRILAKEDFTNDNKDAGDMGAGHTVTALYELIPASSKAEFPIVDSLKYQRVHLNESAGTSDEVLTLKLRYKSPKDSISRQLESIVVGADSLKKDASENFTFASAVAEFSMLLRNSKFKANSSYSSVIAAAKRAKGDDEEGYRREFIRLVELAQSLPKYDPTK